MNKMVIGKTFEFEACHNLPDEDIYGACKNMHGHRYELTVEVKGDINEYGWVCNYKELKKVVFDNIIEKYDHSNLNDYFELPTAEIIVINICNTLLDALSDKTYDLKKVRLYETRSSYAEITFD